ncbi:MAG: HD domain-containing protein [Methanobacterium paludis]|nr:HD domain-containing protein [Methanobacterium paludis]
MTLYPMEMNSRAKDLKVDPEFEDDMEYKLEKVITAENSEIEGRIKTISGTMKRLLKSKDYKDFFDFVMKLYGHDFCESIASATHHHKHIGGLFEHTNDVIRILMKLAPKYKLRVNTDVMYMGAFLHDLGKIRCYQELPNLKSGNRPKKKYGISDDGKDMDHLGEGISMVSEMFTHGSVKIVDSDKRQILHIIASHHGDKRTNWGSLVDPRTPEALLVSVADLLSSRLQ